MSAPATHEELIASLDRIGESIDALQKENAELRAALRWAMTHVENVFALAGRHDRERSELEQARAALAKAVTP